jgi:hypothetical protein
MSTAIATKADGLAVECDGHLWSGTFVDATHEDARRQCWGRAEEISGEPTGMIRERGGVLVRVALVEVP